MSDTNIFDLDNVCQMQVPINDNGDMQYVEKIYNSEGQIIWQVRRCNVVLRDNIPVTITYDINEPTLNIISTTATESIQSKTMYLNCTPDIRETNYIVSGFNQYNAIYTPFAIDWIYNNSLEINLKIKTGEDVKTCQTLLSISNLHLLDILGQRLWWGVAGILDSGTLQGNTKLEADTVYYIKVVKNNPSVKVYLSDDGINYTLQIQSSCYAANGTFSTNLKYKDRYKDKENLVWYKNYNTQSYFFKVRDITNCCMYFGIYKKILLGNFIGYYPFKGQIDLNQSTIQYNNTLYNLGIDDDSYITLIRDGNLNVTTLSESNDLENKGQILSGFTSSSNYAHTAIIVNWTTTNETTIVLDITTGDDIITRQELFGMEATDNFELEILNGKLHWELNDKYSRAIEKNTRYLVTFKKAKTTYIVKAEKLTKAGSPYQHYNPIIIAQTTSNRTCLYQHLYLGVDKQASCEAFKGQINLKGSYLIYNNKKYKFKI